MMVNLSIHKFIERFLSTLLNSSSSFTVSISPVASWVELQPVMGSHGKHVQFFEHKEPNVRGGHNLEQLSP